MAGGGGIKLALHFLLMYGASTRLWRASVVMKWANYGEIACFFCLIILLLLANSHGKMSKRPFGMNHYKRGSRRNKKYGLLVRPKIC